MAKLVYLRTQNTVVMVLNLRPSATPENNIKIYRHALKISYKSVELCFVALRYIKVKKYIVYKIFTEDCFV